MTTIARLHELFDLDAAAGVLTWKVSRGSAMRGEMAGTLIANGYLRVKVDGKKVMVHSVIFAMTTGRWPAELDHINGNRSDNRPSNLREATRSQNSMNRPVRSDSRSGIKGVFWCSQKGKWKAKCCVAGRSYYFGSFSDVKDAEAAARIGRERLHKEFARHG